jgi:phosphoribosylpyrophosphate synthetase
MSSAGSKGVSVLLAMFVAATHGLLHSGARAKLDMPAVREVFVTNTVDVPEKDWRKLHVVPVAAPTATALERFLADGSPCADA